MGIYIGQMWRQIIFAEFIEFNFCNFTLKLVLYRKLKTFFDSYILHDFLDSFVSIQSIISYKCIQILWILFLHFPWLDLYWTNVETNNICPIHWIQLLQFYIEVSLMQKIEKFFFLFLHFPWLFRFFPINSKHVKL